MSLELVSAQTVGLDKVRVALSKNFHSFLVRCIGALHGRHAYTPAWHTEVLASRLQALSEGKTKRLIVNVPPRHLKSLTASVALPAWLLGRDPRLAIINVSYAQSLSDDFARKCRTIMASDWYRDLFPTRLASAREPLQRRDDHALQALGQKGDPKEPARRRVVSFSVTRIHGEQIGGEL